MPDEATPAEGGNSAIDWDTPENPYLQRFKDTQAGYTQSQQRLAELERYEQDEQAFLELAQRHGYQFDEPAAPPPAGFEGGVDPALAQVLSRLDEIDQRVGTAESRFQDADIQAGRQKFNADLDGWATEAGLDLDKYDRAAIFQQTLDADEPGPDAARAAFEEFAAHAAQRNQRVIESYTAGKRRAPRPAATSGEAAGETKPWHQMTDREREAAMADRMRELQDSNT